MSRMTLVGIKVVGRQQELSHRVPLAWIDLTARLDEISDRSAPPRFYGVCPESDHLGGAPGGVYTYWVAVEMEALGACPPAMATLVVPAQEYAIARCEGPGERIEPTYRELTAWLHAQDRATDPDGFVLEVFDPERQHPTPPYERFDYEIWKPLLPAA